MADRVHHPLALDDEAQVEIGGEDALAFREWRHEMCTLWRDDRGHAAATQRLAQFLVGRDFLDLRLGEPAGRVHHEATALQRMVADRDLDLVGEDRPDHRAGKLGDVDLFVLRHQGVARERIVVLPAGERPDAPDRGLDHREARAVALPPDHALMERGCDLAALEHEPAVGVEHQLRVVERSVVALIDAEHDHDAVAFGRRRNCLGHRARNDHSVLIETDVLGTGEHGGMNEGEVRVPGHEGLGKDHEPRPLLRRLADGREHFRDRRTGRLEIRRDLHRGHANQCFLGHASSSAAAPASTSPYWALGYSGLAAPPSQGPSVNHEGVVTTVQQDEIEHVERIDRSDAGNE